MDAKESFQMAMATLERMYKLRGLDYNGIENGNSRATLELEFAKDKIRKSNDKSITADCKSDVC